jgi:D-alanyl-D-alanine carboxypeptidase
MLSRLPLALLLFSSTALARSSPSEISQARSFPVPPVRARAAVLMDATNGAVLAAVNPHLHLPIASTTKMMTALLALKLGNLSDRITVPKSAFNYESDATVMGLHPGQVVSLQQLLYGLLLPSGADAANTIAIHYGGSEAHFVALMNAEAAYLQLHDTHYVNATGLDAPNEYSSAYDLAVLGQYVSYLPDLMKIAATKTYSWNGHVLQNANHVLFWYPGVDGIKPGYTTAAGLCQVLDVQRDGRHIVAALLNTPDLAIDARNLLNFGLQDFTWIKSQLPGDGPFREQAGADRSGPYLYFPASGHYLRGKLAGAYTANGGQLALGFPRTEPVQEGGAQVQYFQNGALSLDPSTGKVTRLALGSTPLPAATPTPRSATPTPAPPKPFEGSLGPPGQAPFEPVPTRTAPPRPTRTSVRGPTSTPRPSPTRVASGSATTAGIFAAYQRAHWKAVGWAVSPLRRVGGFSVQLFAYGGLAYDARSHTIWLLPTGDRLLKARGFLPAHPGNAYPAGFAPASVLKAIHWLP